MEANRTLWNQQQKLLRSALEGKSEQDHAIAMFLKQHAMVHAAKVIAATGRDLFVRPDLLAGAKAEHAAHLAREPYRCPLPPEVSPPIPPRA